MKQLLLVFIGGGVGSALRYAISKWFPYTGEGIPWHTLTVNVIGSFIIGLVLGHYLQTSTTNNTIPLLIATGFCGGFTTFSAFAFENAQLLKSGDFTSFCLYVIGSILVGILAVLVGIWVTKVF